MIVPEDDLNNPLHRASFYLEDLKFGKGNWGNADPDRNASVDGANRETVIGYFRTLFEEVGLEIDPVSVAHAVDFYAENYVRIVGIPKLAAQTTLTEGILLGLALAAGLKGDVPEVYREGVES